MSVKAGELQFAKALGVVVVAANETQFQVACSNIRNSLTNIPPRSDPNPKLLVTKNTLRISPDRLVEVEHEIDEGKRILFDMKKDVILDVA